MQISIGRFVAPHPLHRGGDHERIKPSSSLVRLPSNPTLTPLSLFPPSPQAVGYKLAVLPVAGALLGTVLAGPLGLLAGFKAAGVAAALGGGALGFAGGSMVQKQRKARLDLGTKQLTAPPPGQEELDKDK